MAAGDRDRGAVGAAAAARSLVRSADGATATLHPVPSLPSMWGSLAALSVAIVGGILRLLLLGWVDIGIAVAVIGLGVAAALLVRRQRPFHSYARLTPRKLTVKRWFGRPRTVWREDVARVVLVATRPGRSSGQPARQIMLFLAADGRCRLSLDCLGVPLRSVAEFADLLAVPVQSRWDQPSPAALRRDYPGSIPAFWSQRVALGSAIAFAIVVLVGVVWVGQLTGQFGPGAPVVLGVTQPERTGGDIFGVADVTVVGLDNPARASIPASASLPATHFAGVEVRVRNTGTRLVPQPSSATVVFDTEGNGYSVYTPDDPETWRLYTDAAVEPGRTETVYVLIRVPDSAVLTRVEFNSTGDDNARLAWIVPARPPPRPAPMALGQAIVLGDETVTVLAVDDPPHGSPSTVAVPRGAHRVGVEVRNAPAMSSAADPLITLSLVDSRGGRYDGVDDSDSGETGSLVEPGQADTDTVYFDVPAGARVVEVDYEYHPRSLAWVATVAWSVPAPPAG